jgi:simple sugar transport system permease protein
MELATELSLQLAALLGATLRIATPLLLCALGGLLSERAGVVDIGLEGKLLASAFAAASAAAWGAPAPLALLAGMAVAMALAGVHGWACIGWRGDQIVSGVAVNLVAAGLTMVFGLAWFGLSGRTPEVAAAARFGPALPALAAQVEAWPLIGPVLSHGLLRQSVLVWLALVLALACAWMLPGTRFGLRLQAVGENPAMVDAAGLSVAGMRYRAVLLAGACCGLAGVHLALALNASFTPGMSAGRGFMALAAMVYGRWQPLGALRACLLFGLLDATAIRLQGVQWPGVGAVPVELIQALPYALTVLLLAGFIGRAQAPAALGRPYTKDR